MIKQIWYKAASNQYWDMYQMFVEVNLIFGEKLYSYSWN